MSKVIDKNGLKAPLTAADVNLKITTTQLDQELYLEPKQRK